MEILSEVEFCCLLHRVVNVTTSPCPLTLFPMVRLLAPVHLVLREYVFLCNSTSRWVWMAVITWITTSSILLLFSLFLSSLYAYMTSHVRMLHAPFYWCRNAGWLDLYISCLVEHSCYNTGVLACSGESVLDGYSASFYPPPPLLPQALFGMGVWYWCSIDVRVPSVCCVYH